MTRRYFWQVPEFVKFRTVFENEDTILGANEAGEHMLFRKDIGRICFDEATALRQKLADLAEKAREVEPFPLMRRSRPSYLSYLL